MASGDAKKKVIEAVEKLPDDATFDEVMERIYFLSKIERGLAEADAGQTVPHDEVKERLRR